MNLKVTTSVKLTSGSMASGLVLLPKANTDYLLSQGRVYIDFEFWTSIENKDNKFDKVFPALTEQGVYVGPIAACSLEVPENQRPTWNATNLYNELKQYLEETYSWTVIIE